MYSILQKLDPFLLFPTVVCLLSTLFTVQPVAVMGPLFRCLFFSFMIMYRLIINQINCSAVRLEFGLEPGPVHGLHRRADPHAARARQRHASLGQEGIPYIIQMH